MNELIPLHFLDQPISVIYDTPLALEKNPDVPPNGFIWAGKTYRVIEMLSSWNNDFKRRGRMARNMQPQHAAVASTRGSLNVGRYYFRVRVIVSPSVQLLDEQGELPNEQRLLDEQKQIFDIYYDRAMKSVDDRKGQWLVYREMQSTA
jgi:hypothetical protein